MRQGEQTPVDVIVERLVQGLQPGVFGAWGPRPARVAHEILQGLREDGWRIVRLTPVAPVSNLYLIDEEWTP